MRRSIPGRPLLAASAGVLVLGLLVPAATADPDGDPGAPTRADVDAARDAVADKRRDVRDVRSDLADANRELVDASIEASRAGERYNTARWKYRAALRKERQASRRADRASGDLQDSKDAMGDQVADSYVMSPELGTLSALMETDGIEGVNEDSTTIYQLSQAGADITSEYDAAKELSDLAKDDAEEATETAEDLRDKTRSARTTARRKEASALSTANDIATRKNDLIVELADLQDVSVEVASRRQAELERRQLEDAAGDLLDELPADELPIDDAPVEEVPVDEPSQPSAPADPATPSVPEPSAPGTTAPAPDPEPTPTPDPAPDPAPEPEPQPAPAPPPSISGAQRAIAFAKQQIGEPYRWGAAGPSAWDCSGLTMGAWARGGKSLPHYSVGQYGASTPIRASQLRPGDLVFWGSSSRSSSIYHVAMYIGGGQIIHAPRTGRPVTIESMYYWIPPNFFARP